jgi:tetratricopeptide (TPR) repeat protein
MTVSARLSATMIVRDEERFLDGCLRSIVDHVDEIVVVDTGSRDRTLDIAKQYDAHIVERAWVDDFAAARNWALDAATGEWVLYIDADERLSVPDGVDVRAMVGDTGTVAYSLLFQPRVNFTPYRELRIFRNDPRIRFEGVIHESMHPALERVRKEDGLAIKDSPLRITHLGYEGDVSRKHKRNLPLLKEAVREQPRRIYLWQQVGEIHAAAGERDEAVAAFRQAAAIARSEKNQKQLADASLGFHTLAMFLAAAGDDPMPALEEGLEIYPGHRALQFLKAKALVAADRYEEALGILGRLLREDGETFYDPLVAYDRRIFGELSHQLAGVALLRLGRTGEAAEAFERAAAEAPDDLGQRSRAVAVRAMAARAGGAIA